MEIISYVGFNNSKSISKKKITMLPLQIFRNSKRINFPRREKRNIARNIASVSPGYFNVRTAIPYSAIPFFRSVRRYLKSHIWILFFAIFCCVSVFAGIRFSFYSDNHTGPISLESKNGESELSVLDEIMSKFALAENTGFSENGVILDSDGNEITSAANLIKTAVTFQTYTVQNGDTISGITRRFGLTNLSTLIGMNNISNAAGLRVGQKLVIPSIDGLNYTVKEGDTLISLSVAHGISIEDLLDVNDLSSQSLIAGKEIFIPGARLSNDKLSMALGTYFAKPLSVGYRISSRYGNRADPFTGQSSFHTGIDLACPSGTPIKSTQAGTVAVVSYSNVFGNYILINHGNGYQSLYAHLSKVSVTRGQRVSQGTQIGLAGSTGYSTGPHLHFTVYKNGNLVNPSTLVKF